jgi:hypothetical protein
MCNAHHQSCRRPSGDIFLAQCIHVVNTIKRTRMYQNLLRKKYQNLCIRKSYEIHIKLDVFFLLERNIDSFLKIPALSFEPKRPQKSIRTYAARSRSSGLFGNPGFDH